MNDGVPQVGPGIEFDNDHIYLMELTNSKLNFKNEF